MEEKGLDLDSTFEIEEDGYVHIFDYNCMVDAIKATTDKEQQAIKAMLIRIDFANGKVEDYFKHLAKALILNDLARDS